MTFRLSESAVAKGYRLRVFDTLASTNDAALQDAGDGDPGCLWLVAREQTAGRGRHGRVWASPPGNLYATLLLIDPAPLAQCAQLGFVAGAALARTAAAIAPDEAIGLKWPNDLVCDGAKLSGLLLEARPLSAGRNAVAIGFGVNCLWHPGGLAYATTDLSKVRRSPCAPEDVFAPLTDAMVEMLELWGQGTRFHAVRSIWLDFAAGLGDVLRVDTGTQSLRGVFETIDAQGRLLLRTENGTVVVDAGDVFLQAQPRLDRVTRT